MSRALILLFLSFSLINCSSSAKNDDSDSNEKPRSSSPKGPVMVADSDSKKSKRKKRRVAPKSCRELYDLLFSMNDFHSMSLQICVARADERCDGEFDCFAQKSTLCHEKYYRNQYSYMKRFRKRKCWRELNADPS